MSLPVHESRFLPVFSLDLHISDSSLPTVVWSNLAAESATGVPPVTSTTRHLAAISLLLETVVLKKGQEANILDVLEGTYYSYFMQVNMVPWSLNEILVMFLKMRLSNRTVKTSVSRPCSEQLVWWSFLNKLQYRKQCLHRAKEGRTATETPSTGAGLFKSPRLLCNSWNWHWRHSRYASICKALKK